MKDKTKICSCCLKEKTEDEFYNYPKSKARSKFGKMARCIKCFTSSVRKSQRKKISVGNWWNVKEEEIRIAS